MSRQVPEVVVVGSANIDLVAGVSRFPRPGETVTGSTFEIFTGGKGANQACAIARLGARPRFIGKVGNDAFGMQVVGNLRKFGVDTTDLHAEQNLATGTAMIAVSDSGENTIIVSAGANASLDATFIDRSLNRHPASTVLVQLEIPIDSVRTALRHGKVTILNPAPAVELPKATFEGLHWITPNETEAEHITGIQPRDDEGCQKVAAWFFDQGVKNVVITLGARGSYLVSDKTACHCGTIPVSVVDTTAAGDAFNGALAKFLNDGRDPQNAVLLANRAGALSTTKMGAQTSMPTLGELRLVSPEIY